MNVLSLKDYKNWGYDQKALAAFILAAFFIISIIFYAFLQLGNIALDKKNEISRLEDLLARAEQVARGEIDQTDEDSALFVGDNLAQIQSSIQAQMQNIGDRYRIALDSVQALNPSQVDQVIINQLRLVGSIPEENFAPFLEELITQSPPIFPLDFDVRPLPQRRSREVEGGSFIPKLSFRLTISALAKDDPAFGVQ